VPEPTSQLRRRADVLDPLVERCVVLADAAGPKPVHQDPVTVTSCRIVVHPLDADVVLRPHAMRLRQWLCPPSSARKRDRTHLDLWADDKADQQAHVERLILLGAQKVDWEYPADADFIVRADPPGC
jgi:hypothetical protein